MHQISVPTEDVLFTILPLLPLPLLTIAITTTTLILLPVIILLIEQHPTIALLSLEHLPYNFDHMIILHKHHNATSLLRPSHHPPHQLDAHPLEHLLSTATCRVAVREKNRLLVIVSYRVYRALLPLHDVWVLPHLHPLPVAGQHGHKLGHWLHSTTCDDSHTALLHHFKQLTALQTHYFEHGLLPAAAALPFEQQQLS